MTNWNAMITETGTICSFMAKGEALRWIAAQARIDVRELWTEDRSSSMGTAVLYEVLHGQNGHRVAEIWIEDTDSVVEPKPGWEDRAVQRARAAGMFNGGGTKT